MAIASLAYVLPVLSILPEPVRRPDIHHGLELLVSPFTLLALAAIGIVVFVYLGVSKMTTATVRLGVRDR
jgi:hypothetical protein